jgi:hypothetical protein
MFTTVSPLRTYPRRIFFPAPRLSYSSERLYDFRRTERESARDGATAAAWFSTFFENAFVRRVNRRIPMRIVRLARSMYRPYSMSAAFHRDAMGCAVPTEWSEF